MYSVETHNNSKEYFSNLNLESDAYHVAATTAISNAIVELSKATSTDRWRIIDIENFIKHIYPKWNDTLNQLRLKTELRKIIISLRSEVKDSKILRELNFQEDNLGILLSDISFVAEAGVKELKYTSASVTKETFKLIYNRLLKTSLFSEITTEILNVGRVSDFEKRFKGNETGRVKIKKVYFYNINYLDLKRYLIVELLKLSGYEVIFRIPYFNGLKVINKCWDMVYKEDSIFLWKHYNGDFNEKTKASKFLAFLEGRDVISSSKEAVVTKTYNEINDFRKDLKGKKVISFIKDSLKPCMDTKENTQLEHCFQSALGRFLAQLYNCKLRDNTVQLDFNTYRELITSGWIESRGWNGIKLSEYLQDNEAYFEDIETIDDILYRIGKIKELEEVNEIFEEPAKARIKKSSLKRFLSNPFRAFGYADFEKYNITLNYFEQLTTRLKNFIIRALSEKEGLLELSSHLDFLKLAFRNEYIIGLYNNGNEIEKKITSRIWTALNNKAFSDFMHKDEVQELFNVMLKLKKTSGQESQPQEELDFSIDHLEGIILRDRMISNKDEKAIHVSDLSYKAYETYISSKKIGGKILAFEDFGMIFNYSLQAEHKNLVMRGLKLQESSSKASEAYLKFAMGNLFINFSEGKKEFSWIAGLRDDDDKAIILKQLEALYEGEVKLVQELDDLDIVPEDKVRHFNEKSYDRKAITSDYIKIPEVAYRDLDFCDSKFLYSTILDEHPVYYTEFHQKLAFAGIIAMLKDSMEDSYTNISKYIFPLFPQWLPVVKENILTCEYARKNLHEYRYFDGINYPKTIDYLYLLKSRYIVTENNKIRNRYNKGDFKADKYYDEFLKEYLKDESYNNGLHCKMCPHIYLCRKGEFVIDNK